MPTIRRMAGESRGQSSQWILNGIECDSFDRERCLRQQDCWKFQPGTHERYLETPRFSIGVIRTVLIEQNQQVCSPRVRSMQWIQMDPKWIRMDRRLRFGADCKWIEWIAHYPMRGEHHEECRPKSERERIRKGSTHGWLRSERYCETEWSRSSSRADSCIFQLICSHFS